MDSRLLGYNNPIAWSGAMSPRGVHEVKLLSSAPYLLVNERYTGVIRCFDRRNMDASLFEVSRDSCTQQVGPLLETET